jgi:hypothetical protein
MRSKLWLSDTTNIDHAYIDERGYLIGGSLRPKFIVHGVVDPVENVVVDFSTIKKSIKSIIDHNETGFDHKLWWFTNSSNGTITFTDDTVMIETPMITITGPKNIVRIMDDGFDTIGDHINDELRVLYPNVGIELEVELTTTLDLYPSMNSNPHLFRYAHGLRESTSWGCQNIAHGHLSYIAAATVNELATDLLLAKIAVELDNTIFGWKENANVNENDIDISYTAQRGYMYMVIKDGKFIILDNESTIENIVEYVAERWGRELHDAGVYELYVSEGLSKGSCICIE